MALALAFLTAALVVVPTCTVFFEVGGETFFEDVAVVVASVAAAAADT